MSLLPVKLPVYNVPVMAIIKRIEKWETAEVVLVAVDEPDCSWRFLNDNCELRHDWDVVYWEYIQEETGIPVTAEAE